MGKLCPELRLTQQQPLLQSDAKLARTLHAPKITHMGCFLDQAWLAAGKP